MIWLNELVKCKDNPSGIEIRLQGEYNHTNHTNNDKPLIAINLIVMQDDEPSIDILPLHHGQVPTRQIKKQIFSKNPVMLAYQEEPMAEEVFAKYHNKIEKLKMIIEKSDFADLMVKYAVRLTS
tara:strand:+ start:563 stop:934 length:372 start_codon:yes stop_codon:yes gene_type:complete